MRGEAETIAEGPREQAHARGRTHEGEGSEVERECGRPGSLAHDDIDTEVLHGDVEHLFRGARDPMDLVNEEHLARLQARQDCGQVTGVLKGRPTRDAQRGCHFLGDDHGKGRLAQTGRAGEEDVVRGTLPAPRRLEDHVELGTHPRLADELVELARPKRALESTLAVVCPRVDEALTIGLAQVSVLLARHRRSRCCSATRRS